MNLSMKWLSDYIDVGCDIKSFVSGMTISGSKVEGYETMFDYITNVVTGKIEEITRHPDAEKLVVCQINVGQGENIQIVTGASNVNVGDIVPVAMHKSTLANDLKITKGKLRGVESNGMLCSFNELGLTQNDVPYADEDGILILPTDTEIGADIKEVLGLNDISVEFEITSNRPDCLSVLGLAREAAATFHKPLTVKTPEFKGNGEKVSDYVNVEIQNNELCSRYIAGIVKNVKIEPSPEWLRERLRASGVRPINNFVDITNFVMLEYGHPMHAFDSRYIDGGKIVVRNAKNGEKITTLDGIERELSEEMLCICDENKPVAVAGVMGGEYSGIMEDTNTVVFEAACFNGESVRMTSKKLAMRSDSSARFEKGLNPYNCMETIKRALELVELLGCGEVVSELLDVGYTQTPPQSAPFNADWINSFLGTQIPEAEQISYLNELGFTVENGRAIAPYDRIDIEFAADIAEEVARIYGYNNIKSTLFNSSANAKLTDEQKFEKIIEDTMVAVGYNEILTFSFVSPKALDKIALPADSKLRDAVTILNPLGEDTSIMRTTALPSMLDILSRNYNFRNSSAYLFELGNEYIPTEKDKLPNEPKKLTLGCYGEGTDFYTIKGAVTELLAQLNVTDYDVEPMSAEFGIGEINAFHPGRSAVILKNEVVIGYLGEVHPLVLKNYDIGTRAYIGKINIEEAFNAVSAERMYKPLPKFPASTRDLSLICDEKIPVAHIEKAIKLGCGKILESVSLFDVYQGEQIEKGSKSVSYSISMRSHTATLTDEQVDNAMKKTLNELEKIGVSIRS